MAQYDINLREYWRILKKRKVVVILITIVLGLFSTSFAILRAPAPIYSSVCSIKFEKQTTVEGLYARTISWSGGDDIETLVSVIKSYSVFQKVAEELGLIPHRTEDRELKQNIGGIIEGLQSKVEVGREGLTNIVNIKVTDRNPVFAQELANTIALTYKKLHDEDQMKRTTEALKYIDNQLKMVRKKLRESEDEFNRFSQENELISIDLQSEDLLARAKEIQNEIRKLHEDKRELEETLQRLNRFVENPSGSGHDFYSTTANSQYRSTYDTLLGLLIKRDTLLKSFTSKHPEVVAISYEIMENARKMVILLQLQISGIEKREIDLRKELGEVDRKTKVLVDKKLEFSRLKRKVELYNDMTALLEKKNQEALIRRAERPEEVKIVKPALLPTHPINPPKTVATGAMGIIIGLILGMVIGFVVETFDTSLGAIEDVEETLGTQVLGIIPQADAKDVWEGLKDKYPEGNKEHASEEVVNLISHFVPKSMMAESFRALRTNIQFKDAEKKTETIAVTSSSPEEGKTLVAINLAITMAQAGMKVLLVGSDLRKPVIGRVFGVEMSPGLTDILLGNYPWRDTVKTVTDIIMGKMTPDEVMMTPGLDNLHIITSGPIPPNPAELIESGRLTDFIEEAKEDYDMIIFDTSPILSTADAAILGAKVDGVLLVYRVGTVSRGLLRRSTAQLTQVQCNVLGVVLNGMRPEVSPDFQDYKYYTYYYSYGEGEKRRKDRGRIKGFSFLRKKGDSQRKEEEKISIGEEGERLPKKRAKKLNRGRLALMLVAIGFLAAGLLWQSGIIDPFKQLGMETPAKKDQVKPAGKKEHAKKVIQSKPKTVSPKPKPTVSEQKPQPQVKTPIIKPTPVKKQLAVIKTPVVKKEPSRPAVTTKPKRVSTKPKSPVIVKKPEPQTQRVTTIPKSAPVSKHVAVTKTPESFESIPSFPYSVLLSHCRSVRHAEEVVSRYRNRGLAPYWVKVELSNGIWYRVFVGHFEDRERAEKFRQEHGLQEAVVKKTRYANLINIYGPSDELKDWIESLRRIGYSPYVIEDLSGKSRLFLGAFITKEGAEKQYHDLKSKGIESQVVKR